MRFVETKGNWLQLTNLGKRVFLTMAKSEKYNTSLHVLFNGACIYKQCV